MTAIFLEWCFMTSRRTRRAPLMVASGLNALDLARGIAPRHPPSRERAVRERAGHRDRHRGGHAEAFALALRSGLRLVLLMDAKAVHDWPREPHVTAGPDAVRVHDVRALFCGHRLVEGAGVLGLRPRAASAERVSCAANQPRKQASNPQCSQNLPYNPLPPQHSASASGRVAVTRQ